MLEGVRANEVKPSGEVEGTSREVGVVGVDCASPLDGFLCCGAPRYRLIMQNNSILMMIRPNTMIRISLYCSSSLKFCVNEHLG